MGKSKSKAEEPKEESRFDPDLLKKGLRCDLKLYNILKHCSDKKDMTEWDNWRNEHVTEDVFLEGANFKNQNLTRANLRTGDDDHEFEGQVYLRDAIFWGTTLDRANFTDADLRGARFYEGSLKGTILRGAIVDGSTQIWRCEIDRKTDAQGVVLGSMRLRPRARQFLEYNDRRWNWHDWYEWKNWQVPKRRRDPKKDRRSRLSRALLRLVLLFWWTSDYGRSTGRILGSFVGLALFFAAIYSNVAYWFPPGIVSNLGVEPHLPLWHYFLLLVLRPVYFSVVTMTTLGFGDMYANAQSIWGHILLTIQVILGYVLLGALVTRFAVLFTAGGPAGEFADEEEAKKTR